jgi:hypothetical protein
VPFLARSQLEVALSSERERLCGQGFSLEMRQRRQHTDHNQVTERLCVWRVHASHVGQVQLVQGGQVGVHILVLDKL